MNSDFIYDSKRHALPAIEELRELIRYRDLLFQLIRRDVLTRYKRSVLGIGWTMLNPLGTMLILSIVFSQAFGQGREYPAYILSGLIAWNFFSQTTHACMIHMVWGEGLLKRIYIPRTVFAISAIGVGVVNVLFSIVPILIVMLIGGITPSWTLLFLPVPILLLGMFALGVGLFMSALAVYFADVAEMYGILITAWMYLTPVIYPLEYLEKYPLLGEWMPRLNPMYHLVTLFRQPIYYGVVPDLMTLLAAGAFALGTLIVGWLFFTSRADEFAYRV